ncbi:CRISPR-associated helicase Cas3' [candidate division KSB1 bacterium]|nr:CRISPR-associated helicase Cas3' [candidate division KSB1 bacterium]
MDSTYFAHTIKDNPNAEWQPLKEHLSSVAHLAKKNAEAFGEGNLGEIAGLVHDLGKYADQFQIRLHDSNVKGRDHSTAGAALILQCYKHLGEKAALAVEGHHIGLKQIREGVGNRPAWREWLQEIADDLQDPQRQKRYTEAHLNVLMKRFQSDGFILPPRADANDARLLHDIYASASAMLDVRMLLSALVDADYTDTEAYCDSQGNLPRHFRPAGPELIPQECQRQLKDYIENNISKNSISTSSSSAAEMQFVRTLLRQQCLKAADEPRGLFTLTAPTGSGKTLAMLTFALEHAAKHGLRRIVLVMPYLNIIEQTAKVYSTIFDSENGFPKEFILEDHSLARQKCSNQDEDSIEETGKFERLLSDNWDAPIILTTNVKLLESLMSNRPQQCRKLHRLAKSVILFDEVQTLPPKLVVPTLATISRLADPLGPFGCSVVFSTATQPAFGHLHKHVCELNVNGWQPTEIVKNPEKMFIKTSKRAIVHWQHDSPIELSELADRMKAYAQVLCIVNLKRHAIALIKELKGTDGLLHLSTNMCPAHRKKTLETIHERLNLQKDTPIRLIATQCVEAGVDIDFPVVYRALAPLDSLAQAAGRCNRHNLRKQKGSVFIFRFKSDGKSEYPPGYKEGVQATEIFLNALKSEVGDLDQYDLFNNPAALQRYYKMFYDLTSRGSGSRDDELHLWNAIREGDFNKVADLYRLIDQTNINILVPYHKAEFDRLVAEIFSDQPRNFGFVRQWISEVRPYTVSLFRPKRNDLMRAFIAPIPFSRYRTNPEEEVDWFHLLPSAKYDDLLGLDFPDSLIY